MSSLTSAAALFGVAAAAGLGAQIWRRSGTASSGASDAAGTPPSTTFDADYLHAYVRHVLMSFGVPAEDAALASDVLQSADLRGIDSHGVARLFTYVELLQAGRINPTPKLKVTRGSSTTAVVDGDNGLGLVVGPRANDIAMGMAAEHGSGWVSVCNTNHYGMSMTNTTKLVAPFNGAERMLGTNPIAVAFPAGEEPAMVVDMATSAVAYGKIEIARRLGKPMPEGWAIDASGAATTNPQAMMDGGAMLPLGSDADHSGHKGYCLSSWVDVMCALLSGANWGPHAPPFTLRDGVNADSSSTAPRPGKGIGHFFGAWRVSGFRDPASFKSEMDDWRRTFAASKPAAGSEPHGVQIPGDPEWRHTAARTARGVPITQKVVDDLVEVSRRTGVPFDASGKTRGASAFSS